MVASCDFCRDNPVLPDKAVGVNSANGRNPFEMARDDFNKTTINLLRKRVGGHCANPNCRVATEGPGRDPGVGVVLGVAAHITAASPGGPRYDKEMTKSQRQSADNGIWLCTACATLIDRDESGHSVNLLVSWREQAEAWARSRLNRRPAEDSDAIDLLAGALAGGPVSLSPTAIRNVHDAASKSLQKLDPRFEVTSSFDGITTKFALRAKEPVEVNLKVPVADKHEWERQLSGLREHGAEATLPMTEVVVVGSPLIQAVFTDAARGGAKLRFGPPPRSMTVTLSARDGGGRQQRLFRGAGELVAGLSSMTLRTSLFNEAATLTIQRSLAPDSVAGTFTFRTNLQRWEGKDVRELAELDDLSELADGLRSAKDVVVQVHKNGKPVLGGVINRHEIDLLTAGFHPFLKHVLDAREIANGLGRCIRISIDSWSSSEAVRVREVADIVSGRRALSGSDLTGNPTCFVEIEDQDAYETLANASEPLFIRYVAQDTSKVTVFGQEIDLPPLEVAFESTRAKILGVSATESGRLVEIEWLREPGFRCTFRYLNGKEP